MESSDPHAGAGSVRGSDDRSLNDQVSAMIAELPVGIASPLERVASIRMQMEGLEHRAPAGRRRRAREHGRLRTTMLMTLGLRSVATLMRRMPQASVNTVTTNVPGTAGAALCLGARDALVLPVRAALTRRAHRCGDPVLQRPYRVRRDGRLGHDGGSRRHDRRRRARHRRTDDAAIVVTAAAAAAPIRQQTAKRAHGASCQGPRAASTRTQTAKRGTTRAAPGRKPAASRGAA